MNIGDKILFGEYKWVVLEVQSDKALIITDEIAEQRDYHDKNTDITWKDCEIRKYLIKSI